MDKLKMHTPDIAEQNYKKLVALFPDAITETTDEDGNIVRAIDKDVLMQEINTKVIDDGQERYQFTWPDKRKSMVMANAPISKTLRLEKEKSVGRDGTPGGVDSENIYIEGDNLDALKLLQETYLGKVDAIYVDPPYNTGNSLIYKNDYYENAEDYLKNNRDYDDDGNRLTLNSNSNGRYHTDWLNMMYPRLKVARDLLSEDGIICLTIDEFEIYNITKIMNEIYGEENHLGTVVIKNNPSGRSTISGVSISHEYALFYGKTKNVQLGRLPRSEKQIARYKECDSEGPFEWVNFRKHGGYREDAPSMYYPIYIKRDGSSFRIPEMKWNDNRKEYEALEVPLDDEFVSYPVDESGRDRRWKWGLSRAKLSKKDMSIRLDKNKKLAIYIKSRMKNEGVLPPTVWDDKRYSATEYGTNYLKALMGKNYFDYPKSIFAVIDCLRVLNLKRNSIVLDFFSGSGTTADAVTRLNAEDNGDRRYILVQAKEKTSKTSVAHQDGYETICDIGEERIRRVGTKLKHETNADLDFGFRCFKVDSSNMKDVYYAPANIEQLSLDGFEDNIKEDRTPEDLLIQVMLDLGILLSSDIETQEIAGKKVFSVADDYLLACFDKDVTEETVIEIAKKKPFYAVFRDNSMANDSVAANFEQIFETYSPETVRKVL
ncbi:site-specific DNA-methyltransferase [Lactobacillus delbrueckii subsp. bulgaricus]|nr:site-specific DNA-methyltransferase [Lactobacillus delbrueckii subsp. bulgaricus]